MKQSELRAHCLTRPGAWPDEPWEGDTVIKVADKIFAFLGSATGATVGVKCGRDAEAAREWRDRYPHDTAVMPYIGRYGWNTLSIGGAIPDEEILEAVDASYDDVVGRLPKSKRP